MMRKQRNRLISLAMTICLCLGIFSNMTMNVDAADGPEFPVVYFGKGVGDGTPIKWYLLPKSNHEGEEQAYFLWSADSVGNAMFWNTSDSQEVKNTWEVSQARKWLNESFYSDAFNESEKAAIVATKTSYLDYASYGGDMLDGDKVFLLSARELTRGEYGFIDNVYIENGMDPAKYCSSDDMYILMRTPYEYGPGNLKSIPGVLTWKGVFYTNPTDSWLFGIINSFTFPLRPGINLNQENVVLFAPAVTAAEDGLADTTSNKKWKVTMLTEAASNFSVTQGVTTDTTVSFTYTGAATGDNWYISAAVISENGDVQYAGTLGEAEESGSMSIDISSVRMSETDHLYVFNNQENGDYNTNFSSGLKEINCESNSYTVTFNLTELTAVGAPSAKAGEDYTVEIHADVEDEIPVKAYNFTVKVGDSELSPGTDFSWKRSTGTLTIKGDKITGDITIKAKRHDHDYSIEADCIYPRSCYCGKTYGDRNPDIHRRKPDWVTTADTHESVYLCCSVVEKPSESHQWSDGTCTVCSYLCRHKGGTATCTEKAVCDICKIAYGPEPACDFTGDYDEFDENGHWHICNREECLKAEASQPHSFTEYVYQNDATYFEDGTETAVCDAAGCMQKNTRKKEGTKLIDTTAPTGEIQSGENQWTSLADTIAFDVFTNTDYDVTVTAEDKETGIQSVEYLLSDAQILAEDLEKNAAWIPYTAAIKLEQEGAYILYVKITDCSGNVAYLSSNAMVIDKTAPVISGIQNSKTYCSAVEAMISETWQDRVTINEKSVTAIDNQIKVNPAEGQQTIVVSDKAGNCVTYTITVNDGHQVTAALGKEATCTEKAVCGICQAAYGEPLGHDFTGAYNRYDQSGHWHNCKREGCLASDTIQTHSFTKYVYNGDATYLADGTETAVCDASGCEFTHTRTSTGSMIPDTTAPDGEITMKENGWKSFIEAITFGIFTNDRYEIEVTAEDKETGVQSVAYLVSETAISKEEIAAVTGWTEYNGKFTIEKEGEHVVYAKISDNSGNVVYLSSDGMVIDKTNPVISGIENGKTYCSAVEVQVSEQYIKEIIVGNISATGDKVLVSPSEEKQTITAVDKAGNRTTYTILVNAAHSYGSPVFYWSEDAKECKVTFTCIYDDSHSETIAADVTSVVKSPATTEKEGVTTYTATVTFEGQDYTEQKDVTDIPIYKVLSGANQSIQDDHNGTISITCDGEFEKFTGIQMDGETVDPANYTAVSGSTVVTFAKSYLNRLKPGVHTVTFMYTDGYIETALTVTKSSPANSSEETETVREKETVNTSDEGNVSSAANVSKKPNTGDANEILLWLTCLVVSGAVLAVLAGKRKRISK